MEERASRRGREKKLRGKKSFGRDHRGGDKGRCSTSIIEVERRGGQQLSWRGEAAIDNNVEEGGRRSTTTRKRNLIVKLGNLGFYLIKWVCRSKN